MTKNILLSIGLLSSTIFGGAQNSADINEAMMQSTFFIKDEKSPRCGSGFVILKHQTNGMGFVFTTANHVLTNFVGENAIIMLRQKVGPDTWQVYPYTNRIREGTNYLYTKHPLVDIAAFYIELRTNSIPLLISEDLLLDEKIVRDIGLGPGTELLDLGYPFGLSSTPELFASLRSGRIASYPILPVAERNSFDLAITSFGGNSGGPVYISNYVKPGTENILPNPRHYGIVGILTTSKNVTQTIEAVDETLIRTINLGFSGVIHAQFIKETIELLPKHW